MTTGCNHWLGHRWPKWGDAEPITLPGMAEGSCILIQQRSCLRCNMLQKYEVSRLAAAGITRTMAEDAIK